MFRYSLSWYIFTLTLLESIIKTHLTLHDSSHGFINNNQAYFKNDLGDIHEEIASGLRSGRINEATLKLRLKFEPAFLDFKHRALGVPHLEKVTLFNIDSNRSIDMTSISGSTVHFHSSFFEDKKIPPLGNTSFNVVFLGREEGSVESSLYIHTTEGHFKYNVKGESVFSPYRLRPIVGIKLPINASFSPLIYMHNPHMQPMQIVEVYSSGGDFHLELPSGELEGPKEMWEIPPLQTKAVIRVRFQAKSEQNHTAYVRIKVNSSEEVLVVPLEVEVSANAGLFDPQGSIDFGVGGSLDVPKNVDLCVYNPLKKAVRVNGVVTSSDAIDVEFESLKLPPGVRTGNNNDCVKIAKLRLDWKKAFKNQDYSGKIVVKYKNGKGRTEIPYYLTVLEGGILYDPLITRYFINDKSESLSSRNFKIKNSFLSSVRLINYTLPDEAQKFFKVENFKPLIIKSQHEANILVIKLKSSVKLSELRVNSYILLKTNISDVTIPLLSYNGKLQVHLPFKSKDYSLDLGLISFDSTKEIIFLILNNNPVSITIKSVKTSISKTTAALMGCGTDDYKKALLQVNFQNLTKCNHLKTGEYAIIRLLVQTLSKEGQIWGDVQIETQYENLSVPVHFKVAPGKLEIGPDRLVFDQCFPGKICSHPLRVHSTFNDPMIIEDIVSLPPDHRLSSNHTGHILARATKVIGHLYLDPSKGCGTECYTGLQHDTTAQWLKTLSLSKSIADFDLNLVNTFYNRYLNLTANGSKRWQNLTLRLDTSEVRGHIFKTRVKMSWPSLLSSLENNSIFIFPLTQIGNVSYRNITIKNPSSYNLVVQIVLDRNYPDLALIQEGVPLNFIPLAQDTINTKHGFFFHDGFRSTTREFEESLNLNTHPESLAVLLMPGQNFTFSVGFKSDDTVLNTALVFIRNNLTILEIIKLKGQGAHPLFKFGNRKPGSSQPLSFELTEKHLKDCEREKQYRNLSPNLTVKRSFTARNIGDVSIYVNTFYINDMRCEGYGFKVLNCGPFILLPNRTKKIDIAFTPDLTLSKVTRMLILDTSLNFAVNYTLYTTIPPYYLNLCSNIIQRPVWEIYLSYITITFMFLLFSVISFLAMIDAEKIKKQTMASLIAPSSLSTQPVLDLRLVGQQTRAEIKSGKQDEIKAKDCDTIKSEDSGIKQKESESNKYTVLIPTTGKSKKKLAKKNSSEIHGDVSEAQIKKATPEVQIAKKKVEEKKISGKDRNSKMNAAKKVTKNNTVVPVYEEETSSTTTESSSNNDELNDKEVDQRNSKICSTKKPCNNNNNSGKGEDGAPLTPLPAPVEIIKPTPQHMKIERKKSGGKPVKNGNNLKIEGQINNNINNKSVEKKGNKSKEKRDKQHVNKKSDKSSNKNGNNGEKRESPSSVRLSPAAMTSSSSVWGENRATFSDVVARSENNPVSIANTRPLSQTQTTKPTMYVEPYKQTPTELGPIGSRRIDYWSENDNLAVDDQSNSFFSNTYDLPADPNFLEDFVSNNENWVSNQSLMNLLDTTESTDMWNENLNSNSYWYSMYSPLAETLQMQQQQQQQQQQPSVAPQPGYLWGSSPVWQPWAPTNNLPKTPTRTPPGFDTFEQIKREDSPPATQPPRDTYNPFGTNNIWTQQQQQQQHQPNPWHFQGP